MKNGKKLPPYKIGQAPVSSDTWYFYVESVIEFLKAYSMTLTCNHDDAQDLVQETLTKAWKNREMYTHTYDDGFKSWTGTIMKNTFINQYRKAQKERQYLFSLNGPSVERHNGVENTGSSKNFDRQLHSRLELESVRQAIRNLKEPYQMSMVLFSQEFKYKEIAAKIGVPLGTVKSRISVAREKLKDMLARE